MTPEAQRIELAKACGWKTEPVVDKDGMRTRQIPDYLSDLNAMHEAEKVLNEHPSDKPGSSRGEDHARLRYIYTLTRVVGAELINHHGLTTYAHHEEAKLVKATAAQRAEAFLRTLGLWRDD